MIHIIASLTIKDGNISEMKQIYKSFVPKVEAEEGLRFDREEAPATMQCGLYRALS